MRAAILASLRLHPGQVLWDIGAGSGSVGLEASLLLAGGRIVAVEKNPQRAAQISANRDKFGVANLDVVCGEAPACLAGLPAPHRVFIGGGGDAGWGTSSGRPWAGSSPGAGGGQRHPP